VVQMSSYAPLFGHVDAWQWTPNLIWFDNLRSYGTPNYYVQKMFSVNRGTRQLPVLLDGSTKNGVNDLYTSASVDEQSGQVILKVVNTGSGSSEVRITLAGANGTSKTGTVFVLQSSDMKAENSLDHPTRITPVERQLPIPGGEFVYTFTPHSFTVLRIASR
jgi:alpha-N-arabinofuranosidase